MIIDAAEPKSMYLWRMEKIRQAMINMRHESDIHVRIKKMHTQEKKLNWRREKERLHNVNKL
jgi:hypothetical protein